MRFGTSDDRGELRDPVDGVQDWQEYSDISGVTDAEDYPNGVLAERRDIDKGR